MKRFVCTVLSGFQISPEGTEKHGSRNREMSFGFHEGEKQKERQKANGLSASGHQSMYFAEAGWFSLHSELERARVHEKSCAVCVSVSAVSPGKER